jgi:hypothetical protein
MCLALDNDVLTHSRRIDPISRSTKPFCQGEAGAVGLSRYTRPRGTIPSPITGSNPERAPFCRRSEYQRTSDVPDLQTQDGLAAHLSRHAGGLEDRTFERSACGRTERVSISIAP